MSFSSQRFVTERSGSRFTKLRLAWVTRELRSARKRSFFTQPCWKSTFTRAITVRVLPEPVAITRRAFRRFCPKAWQTALIALS